MFCGENSQLTSQCQKLGGHAKRFSRSSGDLSTQEGRHDLFVDICLHQPRNIWFAPSCYPWCAWSQLNGSRSESAWQELIDLRTRHLVQVALGIVLHRWQRLAKRHPHWEQPNRSLMFKLPYFQEIFSYSYVAEFDMCVVGDLRDPVSLKPMKKAFLVVTTSKRVYDGLHNRKCQGNHEHQVIEGSIVVNGHRINRSQFSENYTRKFARAVCQIFLKYRGLNDPPVTLEDRNPMNHQAFVANDEPPAKRSKGEVSSRGMLRKPNVSEPPDIPCSKRRKLTHKQEPQTQKQLWENIFSGQQLGTTSGEESGKTRRHPPTTIRCVAG